MSIGVSATERKPPRKLVLLPGKMPVHVRTDARSHKDERKNGKVYLQQAIALRKYVEPPKPAAEKEEARKTDGKTPAEQKDKPAGGK